VLHLNGLGRVLFDGDSCLNREKAKGEKRRKTTIAELCRDAEDAESRKRKLTRTADTSGHWRIASGLGWSVDVDVEAWFCFGVGWGQTYRCEVRPLQGVEDRGGGEDCRGRSFGGR